jgi:hypothetical protein
VSHSPTIREQMISQGLIRVIEYKDWIEGGFENERGHVEIFFPALGFGIIQPYRFRDKRLMLPVASIAERSIYDPESGIDFSLHTGSAVEFDLAPQKLRKSQLPQVSACRLLLPKGNR